MKKFKKVMALSLALAMGLSLAACGDKDEDTTAAPTSETPSSEDSETPSSEDAQGGEESDLPIPMPSADGEDIYVYSWNDELGNRIDAHFRTKYPELESKVHYENLNVSGTTDEYPAKISAAAESGDKYPSIFASDESLALSFMQQSYTAPVTDSGLTLEMYEESAYPYTIDYGTNADGDLMAVTWQATPGIFLYNKAIAEEVLGTSDPKEVQDMVSDWDGFFEVAAKMKEAGYAMVSGPDEVKYPFLANKEQPWVVDGKLTIGQFVTDMLETSKKIYDEGYSTNSAQWSSEWTANMSNGTVFCFFGTTWFMSDTVFVTEDVKYQACAGPMGYYWGGSYFLYGKDCPNPELAALVMYTLTCDEDAMYDMWVDDGDYPNNMIAAEKAIAEGAGALDKLDGQNPVEAFHEGAQMIDLKNSTSYDSQINNCLSTVSTSYNTGVDATIDDAIADLKGQVSATITDIVVE